MSPDTSQAATTADARRRRRSTRHGGPVADPRRSAEAVSDHAPQPGTHQPVPDASPWPDTVANPRRTRVR